jgi:hypothetical protein
MSNSRKLEKANHLKRWDAKPLALLQGEGKAAGLPGENPSSQDAMTRRWAALLVECISVGFRCISTEVLLCI